MPWRKERGHGCPSAKPWAVVKTADDSVAGCHATETEANRQIAALYESEELAINGGGPETGELAMVAIYPRSEEAQAFAVEDGLAAEDMHVTLIFLGDAAELDEEITASVVGEIADELMPLAGEVGGIGRFGRYASQGEGVPIVLLPDVRGLTRLREHIFSALEERDVHFPSEHDFVPHMTLRYTDSDEMPDDAIVGEPLHFDAVSVVVGGRRQDYPLGNGGIEMSQLGTATVKIVPDFTEFDAEMQKRLGSHSTVTVTISEDAEQTAAEVSPGAAWEGILAFEGYPSDGDSGIRRFLMNPLGHRELPLTLMFQRVTEEGHSGAELAGRIDLIERIPVSEFDREEFTLPDDIPDDAFVHFGSGVFDSNELGQEAARLVEGKMLRGVSVDLAGASWVPLDMETFEEISEGELGFERMLGGVLAGAKEAKIGGATLVPHPSFGHARVDLVACAFSFAQIRLVQDEEVFAACAAGPIDPPAEWFEDPKFKQLTPLTVTDDGRVFGHVSTWDCHAGYEGMCMTAKPSRDSYASFHNGGLVTAENQTIRVGRMTVKEHAPFRMTPQQVMAHYSDAKKVAAFVRIYDDGFGIAAAGVTRSDASRELLRDFLANPPSPDWRRGDLLGFSSVPLPGLAPKIPEAYFVASAVENQEEIVPEVLILPPVVIGEPSENDVLLAAAAVAGPETMLSVIAGETAEYLDDMRTFTEEQRREAARRGQALPDGSFPIITCGDAENAIRAQGRAAAGKQGRVRAHIRKRVRSLGCSGTIFDGYK